uniref:Uncharacterized protein n=1 Tax=Caenorhabditis tropicalis TaxID=1561998 RepID=A0A1I7UVY5_9PELO
MEAFEEKDNGTLGNKKSGSNHNIKTKRFFSSSRHLGHSIRNPFNQKIESNGIPSATPKLSLKQIKRKLGFRL